MTNPDGSALPLVGQGTWMIERDDESQVVAAMQLGLDLGMTLLDTAEMYGDGRAEEIVGAAIRGRRERVFLVSKVLPSNASYDGTRRACDRSLKRLGVESLDLYLLHWAGHHPIGETMRALESLVREKSTRYIGVSNFDVQELKSAQRALKHEPIACNQVLYHLGDRGIERGLIPYCRQQNIEVMGYSPFGHRGFRTNRELAAIAARCGKTVRQVVLNFLTRDGVYAIPKSGKPEHVRENSGAAGWRLPEEDFHAVDALFPAPDHDVPLGMI